MMKIKNLPANIKPYACHGLELDEPSPGGDWVGDCPDCGKHKFYISEETGLYDCKVCGSSGNTITFITELAQRLYKTTTPRQYRQLSADRSKARVHGEEYTHKLPTAVLKDFKVAYNKATNEWVVPCRSATGTVKDLRHWHDGMMMATAGIKLQLGGEDRIAKMPKDGIIWLCEGEWDAVWMQHLLNECGIKKDRVSWLPGAAVFKQPWIKLFNNKAMHTIHDADKAGDEGALRVHKMLKKTLKSGKYINWPEGADKGFDLRDFIIYGFATGDSADTILEELKNLLESTPRRYEGAEEEEGSDTNIERKTVDDDIDPISFKELVEVFSNKIAMDDDMTDALRVCMATALSNDLQGDPLWMYLIGPPGAGKTLLLASMATSARCRMVSTITPHALISGWRGDGENDPSLIPQLKGKTFIAKDFTEILDMPPFIQDEIFSTLRGAFDGTVEKPFGNGVIRSYTDCHFSMIAGVTPAINGSSKASLGERFLKFKMKEHDAKRNIDIIAAAITSVGKEKDTENVLQESTKQYLANRTSIEELGGTPEWVVKRLTALVQLIAVLRADVARNQRNDDILYRPSPEAGTRLAKQLIKLGHMLTVVEGVKEINESIYTLMERVAYDTANEFHLNIIDSMMATEGKCTKSELVSAIKLPHGTVSRRMDDLEILKAVRISDDVAKATAGRPARVYEVTSKIAKLWKESKGWDSKVKQEAKPLRRSLRKSSVRKKRSSSRR